MVANGLLQIKGSVIGPADCPYIAEMRRRVRSGTARLPRCPR